MPVFTHTTLYTDGDGRARWRDEQIPLSGGTAQTALSALFPSGGYQLRESPPGFRSAWHCTTQPQWVFILQGEMEIGLRDGATRVFKPGQHFYSADTLPAGSTFDDKLHGHWSAQRGAEALVTLFVKT